MTPFHTCPGCAGEWVSRDALLDDPAIAIVGYQAGLRPGEGFYLFDHKTAECGTTFGIRVQTFMDLYDGPRGSVKGEESPYCPGYCGHMRDLSRCDIPCRRRHLRELALVLLDRHERAVGA